MVRSVPHAEPDPVALRRRSPEIKVGKVNVDEQQELAVSFRVMSIPMLAVIKDGRLVSQTVGVQSESALQELVQ